MNIVDRVSIFGLWGTVPKIEFKLHQKFNFIIGQNGTGKTTVINLLAAALMADFEKLDKVQFEKIVLTLKEVDGKKRPSIEVTKTPKKDVPYYDIQYRIVISGKEQKFDLDLFAEEQYFRGAPPRVLKERFYRERFVDIQKTLRGIIDVSWLSVYRQIEEVRSPEERRPLQQSAIDLKLRALNNELVRYFSILSKKYADHTIEFQKSSLLSLLAAEKAIEISTFSTGLDIEAEKNSLTKVFGVLGVEVKAYQTKLKSHFDKFLLAREKMGKKETLYMQDFAALYSTWRTHSLVSEYEALQNKKKEIFAQRDKFIEVMNDLFSGRKTLSVSERNELVVATVVGGRDIHLEELSSGEKQLLIILGTALLQEQAPVVYIADEPELSLHVSWQEKLTSSIAQLNPHAQIIFATHSPDIVNVHSDRIVDMEKVLP